MIEPDYKSGDTITVDNRKEESTPTDQLKQNNMNDGGNFADTSNEKEEKVPRISSPPPPVTNLEMPPPPSVNIVEEESLDEEKAEPSHDDFNVFSQGIRGVTVKGRDGKRLGKIPKTGLTAVANVSNSEDIEPSNKSDTITSSKTVISADGKSETMTSKKSNPMQVYRAQSADILENLPRLDPVGDDEQIRKQNEDVQTAPLPKKKNLFLRVKSWVKKRIAKVRTRKDTDNPRVRNKTWFGASKTRQPKESKRRSKTLGNSLHKGEDENNDGEFQESEDPLNRKTTAKGSETSLGGAFNSVHRSNPLCDEKETVENESKEVPKPEYSTLNLDSISRTKLLDNTSAMAKRSASINQPKRRPTHMRSRMSKKSTDGSLNSESISETEKIVEEKTGEEVDHADTQTVETVPAEDIKKPEDDKVEDEKEDEMSDDAVKEDTELENVKSENIDKNVGEEPVIKKPLEDKKEKVLLRTKKIALGGNPNHRMSANITAELNGILGGLAGLKKGGGARENKALAKFANLAQAVNEENESDDDVETKEQLENKEPVEESKKTSLPVSEPARRATAVAKEMNVRLGIKETLGVQPQKDMGCTAAEEETEKDINQVTAEEETEKDINQMTAAEEETEKDINQVTAAEEETKSNINKLQPETDTLDLSRTDIRESPAASSLDDKSPEVSSLSDMASPERQTNSEVVESHVTSEDLQVPAVSSLGASYAMGRNPSARTKAGIAFIEEQRRLYSNEDNFDLEEHDEAYDFDRRVSTHSTNSLDQDQRNSVLHTLSTNGAGLEKSGGSSASKKLKSKKSKRPSDEEEAERKALAEKAAAEDVASQIEVEVATVRSHGHRLSVMVEEEEEEEDDEPFM